jgi:hypothetical protein
MAIKPTSEKAADYVWFAKRCLALKSRGVKALTDGPRTIICKYTPTDAILHILGGDFLLHPRTGQVKQIPFFDNQGNELQITGVYGGGYRPATSGYSEIENRYVYPLQDNDKGTWLLDADGLSCEWSSSENYGNMWWIGSDGKVLSWHSIPNRHFLIDTIYNIPGLTEVENVLGDPGSTKQYFTCFKNNVYQDGEVLATVDLDKHLVAGACYQQGVLLVAAVDGSNGYRLKLLKQKGSGWEQIGDAFETSRLKTPAFFSKDGTTMTFDGAVYTISPTIFTLKTASQFATSGTQTESTNRMEFRKNGTMRGLWLENGTSEELVYSSDVTYEITGTDSGVTTTTVPLVTYGQATAVSIFLDGAVGDCLHFVANANGPYCTLEWGGDANGEGNVCGKGICDEYTVTATLQPHGVTATLYHAANSCTGTMYIEGPGYGGGGTYFAHNANGTVTWTVSAGTITEGGSADFTGECGTVTITATDECGCIATFKTQLPDGDWCMGTSGPAINTDCGPCGNGCGGAMDAQSYWEAAPTLYTQGGGGVYRQNKIFYGDCSPYCARNGVYCAQDWYWHCSGSGTCP